LIEMIGVLAVIAILASLLIPKVVGSINDARVNGVCVSLATLRTAAVEHMGKYGQLNALFGTNSLTGSGGIVVANYDTQILIPEGLLDKPFSTPIGSSAVVQLVAGGSEASGAFHPGGSSGGYWLDGTASTSTTNEQFVLEAVISGVSARDAKSLNDLLDGPALGAVPGAADGAGRVEYVAPASGATTVYIYLTGN
jgi:type II secretory pathway pseudopilin PulG